MRAKGRTATPRPDAPDEAAPEEAPETGPQRRCLVTRVSGDRPAMLRFVLAPDNAVVFDAAATLPGRGMWLSAAADVVEQAVKRGVFARAAKAQVKVPPDLRMMVTGRLTARLTDLLGLARRGGGAVAGFEKAREWLASGRAGLIVQATDGSVEERARFMGARDVVQLAVLDGATLGRVFGRDRAVHVAVVPGPLATMIAIEAARLAGVAGAPPSGQ